MSARKQGSLSARNVEKKQPRSKKGLGDKVEQAIKATRLDVIAKAYTKLTGKDCGCENRKDYLNKKGEELLNIFLGQSKIKQLTSQQKEMLHNITLSQVNGKNVVSSPYTVEQITRLYNSVTGLSVTAPTCRCQATIDTIYTYIERLQGIDELYNQ